MTVEPGAQTSVDIPADWARLPVDRLRGLVLIIGAPSAGKSTLTRYLLQRLTAQGRRVAYLDGDPGQSTLGPPTTLTVALANPDAAQTPWLADHRHRRFLGATTPLHRMLTLLTAAARLVQAAHSDGAEVILYDTCGLIEPSLGGLHLKLAKIDLLRPSLVIGLAHGAELDPLFAPLRFSRRTHIEELLPSPAARPRSIAERQAHRAAQFAHYFADARVRTFGWRSWAVMPALDFSPQRLLALEDDHGFTLGLGVILGADQARQRVTLWTPLTSAGRVDTLNLGDVTLDLQTYRDQPLGRNPSSSSSSSGPQMNQGGSDA